MKKAILALLFCLVFLPVKDALAADKRYREKFAEIVSFVLENGDRQNYCNRYNNNPHYMLDDIDIYLNPHNQMINATEEHLSNNPLDYNRITIGVGGRYEDIKGIEDVARISALYDKIHALRAAHEAGYYKISLPEINIANQQLSQYIWRLHNEQEVYINADEEINSYLNHIEKHKQVQGYDSTYDMKMLAMATERRSHALAQIQRLNPLISELEQKLKKQSAVPDSSSRNLGY